MIAPPHVLLSDVHGELLRASSSSLGLHVQGLAQAARLLRRKGRISGRTAKKLVVIDNAHNVSRQITSVSAAQFVAAVLDELSSSGLGAGACDALDFVHAEDTPSTTSSSGSFLPDGSSLASLATPTTVTEYYVLPDYTDATPDIDFRAIDVSFARLADAIDYCDSLERDALRVVSAAFGPSLGSHVVSPVVPPAPSVHPLAPSALAADVDAACSRVTSLIDLAHFVNLSPAAFVDVSDLVIIVDSGCVATNFFFVRVPLGWPLLEVARAIEDHFDLFAAPDVVYQAAISLAGTLLPECTACSDLAFPVLHTTLLECIDYVDSAVT